MASLGRQFSFKASSSNRFRIHFSCSVFSVEYRRYRRRHRTCDMPQAPSIAVDSVYHMTTSQTAISVCFSVRIKIHLPFNVFLFPNEQRFGVDIRIRVHFSSANTHAHCMVSHWMPSEATKWPDSFTAHTHTHAFAYSQLAKLTYVWIFSPHFIGSNVVDNMTHRPMNAYISNLLSGTIAVAQHHSNTSYNERKWNYMN